MVKSNVIDYVTGKDVKQEWKVLKVLVHSYWPMLRTSALCLFAIVSVAWESPTYFCGKSCTEPIGNSVLIKGTLEAGVLIPTNYLHLHPF